MQYNCRSAVPYLAWAIFLPSVQRHHKSEKILGQKNSLLVVLNKIKTDNIFFNIMLHCNEGDKNWMLGIFMTKILTVDSFCDLQYLSQSHEFGFHNSIFIFNSICSE